MSDFNDLHLNIGSEDLMDDISASNDFDMTNEEEKSLLHLTDDSPHKTSTQQSVSDRKRIIFDLNDTNNSTADDEDEDENQGMRDKFRTERTTINLASAESSVRREIPDFLDFIGKPFSVQKLMESKRMSKKQRKRLNRKNNHFNRRGPEMSNRLNHQSVDLRQFINRSANKGPNNGFAVNLLANQSFSQNSLLQNSGLSLSPLMNWQLGLGILDPSLVQNQLLVNALLAQNASNPLLNRLQMQTPVADSLHNMNSIRNTLNLQNNTNLQNNLQNNSDLKKSKDDIQITIINNNNRPTNGNRAQTKSQIRCRVSHDSPDGKAIANMPSMLKQMDPKPQLKTLFSKHLSNKVNQTNCSAQQSTGSSGGLFGEALEEAAVGCDNDYLIRMKEMENKRREIQRMKEQRRMEMADERLQSAQELQFKITEKNKFKFN